MKILIFSLPVLIGLVFIFFIKANREFCYNYIKGDCEGRGKLLYKKIYTEKNTIDYLFVGSSKTWNDIDDGFLETLINSPGIQHVKLFNTGYCRFGRNLDYLFCKEFLKRNRLKKIFLEVRADESTTSHPIYSYLATGNEVLEGIVALNGSVFPEIYKHTLMNLNYSRCIMGLETLENNTERSPQYGYNNIDRIENASILINNYQKESKKIKNNEKPDKPSLEYRFSSYYIKKIKDLCDRKNIELVFLYLPSYGNPNRVPAFKEEYEALGKVIIPPDSLCKNLSYWKDAAHLNSLGANAYTEFLATQLARK